MIISFGDENIDKISKAFNLIEISDSRELIFHKEWTESLKDSKILVVPKTKAFLKSNLGVLINYYE